eukprot:m.235483 g.235483  ORF g.235483 m.235483 type:complete len:787 (+) comp20087_c0_seq1:24-2384(+)
MNWKNSATCSLPVACVLALMFISSSFALDPRVGAKKSREYDVQHKFGVGATGPAAYVDPHISTGGDGFGVGGDPPGATYPYGMLRASPDTSTLNQAEKWEHYGGYHYFDNEIRCFSQTHMVGPGATDYGNIAVMPSTDVDHLLITDYGYRSAFSHASERTAPGYYSVHLDTPEIDVEIAACGPQAGVYRFSYTALLRDRAILFDLSHALSKNAIRDAYVEINSSGGVRGWVLNAGGLTERNGKGVYIYFAANVSRLPAGFGVWANGTVLSGQSTARGVNIGAFFLFGTATTREAVEMPIALSFLSMDQAVRNLVDQEGGRGFDACRAAGASAWDRVLNTVTVDTQGHDSEYRDELVKFYTALYHSTMAPTTFSEAGGVYQGMAGPSHVAEPGQQYYSDLSLWDVYRCQLPLLGLLYPTVLRDVTRSIVAMYTEGGDLPRWPIANVYASCMEGSNVNLVLLDAYVKGVGSFDVQSAYRGMVEQATQPNRPHNSRSCLTEYLHYGYVPMKSCDKSVSETLEYAYNDWAIAQMAVLLNKTADVPVFQNRSRFYRNLWDNKTEYFCPRKADGTFECNRDPSLHLWILEDSGFCEADQAEMRWFVPHDLSGLVGLFHNKDSYVNKLDEFFKLTALDPSTFLPNPFYWAGNEPDILVPFQFNAAGRPDLTQKYVRFVMNFSYSTRPDGLPGNDDFGALSSWYVWAALGLYPLPGTTTYILASPVFPRVTLALPGGAFTIIAHNASASNVYVQRGLINGRALSLPSHAYIDHADIARGGTLEVWMGASPPQYV